jgi:hypothetical protein
LPFAGLWLAVAALRLLLVRCSLLDDCPYPLLPLLAPLRTAVLDGPDELVGPGIYDAGFPKLDANACEMCLVCWRST